MKSVNGVTVKVEPCEDCGNQDCKTVIIKINTPYGPFTIMHAPVLKGIAVVEAPGIISKDAGDLTVFVNLLGLVESLAQAKEGDELPKDIEEFLKGLE